MSRNLIYRYVYLQSPLIREAKMIPETLNFIGDNLKGLIFRLFSFYLKVSIAHYSRPKYIDPLMDGNVNQTPPTWDMLKYS